MRTRKTFKLVMLPFKKATSVLGDKVIQLRDEKLYYRTIVEKPSKEGDTVSLHTYNRIPEMFYNLYVISNDDANDGDWVIGGGKHLAKVSFNDTRDPKKWIVINQNNAILREASKKVVCTNNIDLIYPINKFPHFPELPGSFILAYIKAYNEGRSITEITLEIIPCCGRCIDNVDECQGDVIKTRPDNTVIVHKSKVYSNEELEQLLWKAYTAKLEPMSPDDISNKLIPEFNKWMDKNVE